jgi:predicted TIM-barrel fold metal-dependent hydrolase
MSVAPGFTDAAAMARALIEAVPDRIIWGSDYPHVSFADKVGSVELFNLLGQWRRKLRCAKKYSSTIRRRSLLSAEVNRGMMFSHGW